MDQLTVLITTSSFLTFPDVIKRRQKQNLTNIYMTFWAWLAQFLTNIIVFIRSSLKNMKSSFFIFTNSKYSSSNITHGYRFIRFLTAKPQKLLGHRSIFTTSHSNRSFKTVNRNQGLWYQELKM